jgi:hypothetical protein
MPIGELASGRCRASRCDLVVRERGDLPVAQTVIDEREDSAGDCDVGLGLASALGDRLESVSEGFAAVVAGDGLDGRPTDHP